MSLMFSTICISGTMPSGKTKAQKTIELKNAGADVVSTVTKKCTHLLVDNVNGSSSKIKKAQAKKIAIVDEDWIDRKMGLSSKTKKTKTHKSIKREFRTTMADDTTDAEAAAAAAVAKGEWKTVRDQASGRDYYVNTLTQKTSWTLPNPS